MSLSSSIKADGGRALLRQVKSNAAAWIALLRRAPRGNGPGARPWSGRVGIGIAVVIIALVAAVMMTLDARAIVASRALPGAFHSVFGFITDFGKGGWFLWPIGIGLIVLALVIPPAIGRVSTAVVAALAVRLTFLFAAIALPGLFSAIIKRLIGRARPFVGGSADPYLYDPLVWKAAYASMPSGHATTAFAALVAIGALWPQTRVILWVYALLIAASRVIITAHHPSDVIAGAVVGAVGAVLVRNWFAVRRLAFAIDAEGHVHRMAMPSRRRINTAVRRLVAG